MLEPESVPPEPADDRRGLEMDGAVDRPEPQPDRSDGGSRRRPRFLRGWLGVAVATAAVVAVGVGALAASRSSLFHVRRIEVDGAHHLSRAQIVDIASVTRKSNALWLDLGAAERRLEAEAWVAEADLEVGFPFTVTITVTERSPVAVVTGGMVDLLVAEDGTSLGPAAGSERMVRGLPVIEILSSGLVEGPAPSPVGAARVLGEMPDELRARVIRVSVLLDGTLELLLREGITVRFGTPGETARKVRSLLDVLAWADSSGERLRSVIVVAPGAPAAITAP
ncbi:MAG TPA: FtsQ-type POTRA domain-containing protein [Actinomycetota bacterium]